MSQSRIFVEGLEGDAYFRRNASHNAAYRIEDDVVAQTIEAAGIEPKSILDLGCSSGERLSALCLLFDAQGMGVDASAEAIRAAGNRDRAVEWEVGDWTQHRSGEYDLVVLSYVLHWIGRPQLLRAMAAAHEATRLGGHLAVNDFSRNDDVVYKHAPGVMTHKRVHDAMFSATGLFVPVRQKFYPYPGTNEACCCSVLRRVE